MNTSSLFPASVPPSTPLFSAAASKTSHESQQRQQLIVQQEHPCGSESKNNDEFLESDTNASPKDDATTALNYEARLSVLSTNTASGVAEARSCSSSSSISESSSKSKHESDEENLVKGNKTLSLSVSIGDHQSQMQDESENAFSSGNNNNHQDSLERLRQICSENLAHHAEALFKSSPSSSAPFFSGLQGECHIESPPLPYQDTDINYMCHLCPYNSTSRYDFNLHVNTHYKFLCCKCDYETKDEAEYRAHLTIEHSMTLEELEEEQGIHVQKVNSQGKVKLHKCKTKGCDFTATTKRDYWLHSKVHLKGEKTLHCPKCVFVTEYKHHLEYHLRNHYGSKPNKCPECNYTCVNKSMLNSHMKSHTTVYQYRCLDCSYGTKYCHSLKLHLRKYGHKPAMVLNPDGTPNPLPIIDVYGTRRGPKVKKDEKGNIVKPTSTALAAVAAAAAAVTTTASELSPFTISKSPQTHQHQQGLPPLPLMMVKFQEQMQEATVAAAAAAAATATATAGKKRTRNNYPLMLPPLPAGKHLREKPAVPVLLEKPLKCPLCDFETRQQDIFDNHAMLHDEPFPSSNNDGDVTEEELREEEIDVALGERKRRRTNDEDDSIGICSESKDETKTISTKIENGSKPLDVILAGIKANLPPGLTYMDYFYKFSPLVMNNINPLVSNADIRHLLPPSSFETLPEDNKSSEEKELKEQLLSRIYLESFFRKGHKENEEKRERVDQQRDFKQGPVDEEKEEGEDDEEKESIEISSPNINNNAANTSSGNEDNRHSPKTELLQSHENRFGSMVRKNKPEEGGGESRNYVTTVGGVINDDYSSTHSSVSSEAAHSRVFSIESAARSTSTTDLEPPALSIPGALPKNRSRKGQAFKLSRKNQNEECDVPTATANDAIEKMEGRENKSNEEENHSLQQQQQQDTKLLKGSHICSHCDIAFLDSVMFELHMGYHGYNNPFTCNHCGEEMKNKIDFFMHLAKKSHA